MGPADKSDKLLGVERLNTDGSNWPLWRATLLSYFESKNLLRHIEGTAIKPPDPPTFPKGYTLTSEEDSQVERAEERMEKYLAREGQVKTQIILSVSESLALMLQKMKTAREVWDSLVTEMTKKPKMVLTSLQRQLRNIRCSEEDDLRQHLDKAQDLYARLNDMGATISEDEFIDIILASLPPSYESVMNALTTSLEECGKPLIPDDIIRVLKSQYDKRKSQSISQEEQVFIGTSTKKGLICANCKKKGHAIETCWAKGGLKEGQGPKQKKKPKSKKKKGKMKANTAEEVSSDEKDDNPIAFTNYDCAALNSSTPEAVIILDTGASSHMTPYRNLLENYQSFAEPRKIRTADKGIFEAFGSGLLALQTRVNGKTFRITLKDTLYAPKIAFTLISIGRCDDAGYKTEFALQKCIIKNSTGKILLQAPKIDGLYRLNNDLAKEHAYSCYPAMEIHKKLGHISHKALKYLLNHGMVLGIKLESIGDKLTCAACIKSKITRKPLPKEPSERSTKLGEKIHSDVWGPSRHQTIDKKYYYVSFTDDYSRESVIYLMNSKDQVFSKYKLYEAMMLRQRDIRIKSLLSDRGGEYTSKEFNDYLAQQGTKHKFTVHDTPEQNGVAERLNRTLVERTRAMLLESNLPKSLWGYAIQYANYIKNRTHTRALPNKTPFEMVHQKKPNLHNAYEWGKGVYVKIAQGDKLSPRAKRANWIGPSSLSDGHYIYWPNSHKVSVERNIIFDGDNMPETAPIFSTDNNELSTSTKINISQPPPSVLPAPISSEAPNRLSEIRELEKEIDAAPEEQLEDLQNQQRIISGNKQIEPPRRSERIRLQHEELKSQGPTTRSQSKKQGSDETTSIALEDLEDNTPKFSVQNLSSGNDGTIDYEYAISATQTIDEENCATSIENDSIEPNNPDEAFNNPIWRNSMDNEYKALIDNKTWEIVIPPENANIVGNRWTFVWKRDPQGNIIKPKSRLVAQGFTQTFGIDYQETYSPVARLTSLRTICAIAARNNWPIHQMDVDNAYLNATLPEPIYMKQPYGYDDNNKDHVLLLKKALYGLKQSGREWYKCLTNALSRLGFKKSATDAAVFYRHGGKGFAIIAAAVDDLTITATNEAILQEIKDDLNRIFKMKDLGELHWLLNLKIERDKQSKSISFSQGAYIDKITKRFNLQDAKPYSTPLDSNVKLTKEQCPTTDREKHAMAKTPYREAIGSLMWAAVATRPDIAFAVSLLSQFLENPGEIHWNAVKRVLRYLKGTKDYKLTLGRNREGLVGYADADWASQEHRHSISAYIFQIDGGAISWSCQKQSIVALSTTEAEFIALTHATKEALWIQHFISEVYQPLKCPIKLHSDNQSAIAITYGNQQHTRTKHFDIRLYFIRDTVENEKITIEYMPTDRMLADLLTKGLPNPKVKTLTEKLGIY
jgi:transposase InsO family protein